MRVRHYGLLANRCRRAKLARIRAALAVAAPPPCAPDPQDAAVISRCPRPALRVAGVIAPRRGGAHCPGRSAEENADGDDSDVTAKRPRGGARQSFSQAGQRPLARYIARTGAPSGTGGMLDPRHDTAAAADGDLRCHAHAPEKQNHFIMPERDRRRLSRTDICPPCCARRANASRYTIPH